MAQHGWGMHFGHHGWLRVAGLVGGLTLIVVAALVFLNAISLLLASAIFAGLSLTGAGLAWNVAQIAARSSLSAPSHQRLLDATAKVIVDLAPEGRVLVQGENWAALLDPAFAGRPIPAGARVRVVGVEDLCLIVTPSVDDLLAQTSEQRTLNSPPFSQPDLSKRGIA